MSDSDTLNRKAFWGDGHPDGGNAKEPRQKIRTIGVLCRDSEAGLKAFLYAEIIERFKSMAERHGYDIFFLSNQIGKTGLSYCDHLSVRKADGVFLLGIDHASQHMRELLEYSIPKIAIDYSDETTGCVMTDCDKSMALLYNYLYDLGHRSIVYLHGEAGYLTGARLRGLKAAMEARGETLAQEHLIQSKYYSIKAGYESMKQALGREHRPTAVIANDDYSAIGAMSAARDMGLAVPDDISIAGFDGFEVTQHTAPKLTTIRQDTLGMGTKAAENLIKQILGVGGRGKPEQILLEPKLIVGDSCRRIN